MPSGTPLNWNPPSLPPMISPLVRIGVIVVPGSVAIR